MMFEYYSQSMYKYIIDAEFMLLNEYKFDPMDFTSHLSLFDLQMYVDRIIAKKKEEYEERNKSLTKDKFVKSLIAIRDILNFMTGFKL